MQAEEIIKHLLISAIAVLCIFLFSIANFSWIVSLLIAYLSAKPAFFFSVRLFGNIRWPTLGEFLERGFDQ